MRVLFVCLGNICRSPLAEGALRQLANEAGDNLAIDSAGTGKWHIGKPPDRRAIAVARANGVDISGFRARQVTAADFDRFTHIFALDAENLSDLRRLAPPRHDAHLGLLLDVVPGQEGQPVADPYFGDDDAFARTWAEVSLAARCILEKL